METDLSGGRGKGQRLLFIDDDETLTTLSGQFLTRFGYIVETSNNPVQALARFREEAFDLVVTDLTMPYVSGLDVARECHNVRPQTPVILMTGFDPLVELDDVQELGIALILRKPYGSAELESAVAEALAQGDGAA